jgi:hypothetical protein
MVEVAGAWVAAPADVDADVAAGLAVDVTRAYDTEIAEREPQHRDGEDLVGVEVPRVRGDLHQHGSLRSRESRSRARLVQQLEEIVSGELDVLVTPLCGAIDAGDPLVRWIRRKSPVDKRVAGLGFVCRSLGQPEMPCGVVLPAVGVEERVLGIRIGWTSPQLLSSTYWRRDQLAGVATASSLTE